MKNNFISGREKLILTDSEHTLFDLFLGIPKKKKSLYWGFCVCLYVV